MCYHNQPQVVTHSPVVHPQSYQAPALQQSYQAPTIQQSSSIELDSRLVVPSFNPFDDPCTNLNKLMAFVTTSFAPRFPQTNNQLRTSSNPRNQATIQDGQVIMQIVKGIQTHGYANYGASNTATNQGINRQCTKPKRPKNSAWFKEKMLLTEALESAKAVLMANLSSFDSDVLSDVPLYDTNIENDMSYQKMSSRVAKCNKVQQENLIVNETLTTELESYKEQVKLFEERQKFDLNDREKYIDGQLRQVIIDRNAKVEDFEKQIDSLKLQLNATVESHNTLSTTVDVLKKEYKQKEDKYLDVVIALQNKNKALDNVVYKMLEEKYMPCDGHTIVKTHDALSVIDTEKMSHPTKVETRVSSVPVLKKEIPRELPTISLVKDSFHKMKEHVNKSDDTITFHTKITGNRIGSWGVEHIKGAFEKDVKPFAQTLKEYFHTFEHGLYKELKEMKAIFNQMETEVAKCSVDKKYFEIEKKEISLDNDHLLEHFICKDVMNIVIHADSLPVNVLPANNKCHVHDNLEIERLEQENDHLFELLLSQDIVHICINSLAARNNYREMQQSFIDAYNENLVLQAELANKKENMVEKKFFDEVLLRCSRLENCGANLKRMKSSTSASRSQPSGNTKNNRISQTTSSNPKNKVKDHHRSVKLNSNKKNRVIEPIYNANVKHTTLNANSELIYVKGNQCMFDANHDVCFLEFVNDVNVRSKSKYAKRSKNKKTWKPTGKVFTDMGYRWKPTRQTFIIDGNTCPLTRTTSTKVESFKKTTSKLVTTHNLEIKIYCRKTKVAKSVDLSNERSILGSRHSNILKPNKNWGSTTLNSPSSSLVNFRSTNAKIRERSFMFGMFSKGKSSKSSHKPKADDTNQEKLYLLHMDLCGPMRVESINRKKYILVIIDDYSRFTWVKFLRLKDEASEIIIKCLKQIQVRLNATVRNVRTNNGTKFVNQTLKDYYENVRISYQTSVARTLQQNGVVKRWNHTLVEATRTMLIFSKAPLYLWAEAVSTACYTQNRSLIRLCYNKTPYELRIDRIGKEERSIEDEKEKRERSRNRKERRERGKEKETSLQEGKRKERKRRREKEQRRKEGEAKNKGIEKKKEEEENRKDRKKGEEREEKR
ncbi:retrovirus-related pol polyprotein from transposon TNT 1-94 [Tanacetum coccineum]